MTVLKGPLAVKQSKALIRTWCILKILRQEEILFYSVTMLEIINFTT